MWRHGCWERLKMASIFVVSWFCAKPWATILRAKSPFREVFPLKGENNINSFHQLLGKWIEFVNCSFESGCFDSATCSQPREANLEIALNLSVYEKDFLILRENFKTNHRLKPLFFCNLNRQFRFMRKKSYPMICLYFCFLK